MSVKDHQKFWRYNKWAWDHVLKSAVQLSEEALRKDRGYFWDSIYGTLAHTVGAEILWLNRLNGNSPTHLPGADDFENLNAIIEARNDIQIKWTAYLEQLSDERAQETLHYQSTGGSDRRNRRADIIRHVGNHSTEHRSQLTPVLFDLGVPTDPLDYIYYCLLVEPD